MNYKIIKVTRQEYDSWETGVLPDWVKFELDDWVAEGIEDLGFSFRYCFYPEYEDGLPGIEYALFAIAKEEGLLGYCTINVENSVDTLEVFPEYRLRGIAKMLLKEANCYDPWYNENAAFWSHIKNTLVRTQ